MVQMVFVHGVNTRKITGDPTYDRYLEALKRRFGEVSFKGASYSLRAPYWGEFGAPSLYTCIPTIDGHYGALSLADAADPTALLDAARAGLGPVVAALSAAALEEANATGDVKALDDAEQLWLGAALYAEQRPNPPWLNTMADDEEFLDRLLSEASAMQPRAAGLDLGLGDSVRGIAAKLKGGFSNLVNAPIAKVGRERLSPHVALFIGDVFRYLKEGDARTKIRTVVLADLAAAAQAQKDGEPLVLAGHSMGAVILYDLLSDPVAIAELQGKLGCKFAVDLFLSVGSQVALFEEIKVYSQSGTARAPGAPKVPRPTPCARWWNVFDKMDLLSFLCEPVFEGVEDFQMDTIASVIDAHSAYFDSMPFYVRLGKRLSEGGLVA
jgi:hypothetical protein